MLVVVVWLEVARDVVGDVAAVPELPGAVCVSARLATIFKCEPSTH